MPPEKSLAVRLTRLLRRRTELRKLVLVYDARDQPPWTCELTIDGRMVAIRSGTTLQAAVSAVSDAASARGVTVRPDTPAPSRPAASAPASQRSAPGTTTGAP